MHMERHDDVPDVNNTRVYHDRGVAARYRGKSLLTRSEARLLLKYHDAWAGKDVLDIGVGTGRTSAYLAPLCRSYLGIDYSPVMLRAIQRGMPSISVALMDMRHMDGVPDASIDCVFASDNVFDAVDHAGRLATLAECHRVLRSGGLLLFSGHNLDWPRAGYAPFLEWRWNPVSQLHQCVLWFRRWRNHHRLRAYCGRQGDHAIYCDLGHDFSLLHYYIGKAAQQAQLHAAGFELIDSEGEAGSSLDAPFSHQEPPWRLYVARKRPAAGS